jgi:hypothetical protein
MAVQMAMVRGCAPLPENIPHQCQPNYKTFVNNVCELGRIGTFKHFAVNGCRQRSIQTPDVAEHILDHI